MANEEILISSEEEVKIKEKAVDKMPLNPTAQGWSGQQIRAYMQKAVFANEHSILSEMKNKLLIIKEKFDAVFGDGDGFIQTQINEIDDRLRLLEAGSTMLVTSLPEEPFENQIAFLVEEN
jgi:hypothetical protein